MVLNREIKFRLCRYELVSLFVTLFLCLTAAGRVTCIRITSEHNADVTDLDRFRQYPAWKDKEGNELALAIWQYLCDYETGLYHFNEILEENDTFDEYATVRDPLKILNVYNMAYCGIFGPVLNGIYQGVGFEQGRAFGVSKWNHCTTEVWYGGGWHYLDLDVRGTLLKPDGTVASLAEVCRNRDLWVKPSVPIQPFFPNDHDKDKVFKIYRDSRIDFYYRWFTGSHTMDFSLRQGESFTRWWKPQGGRWHHLPRYNKTKWIKKLIQTEPLGMKPNHRDFTCWNHGNGLFHYKPNLTNHAGDFADGIYASKNLISGPKGLHLIRSGNAEVIFEVFTPYIIVAKINDLDNINDDKEASVITLEAYLPAELSISCDNGITWQPAGRILPGKPSPIDLTRSVQGSYGYLFKVETTGKKDNAAIKSLEVNTWVQVAPISLPRLKKGTNHLRYEIGDRYGLKTLPMLVQPNTADPQDLKKYVTELPKEYDPKRNTGRIEGEVIMRLPAPPGTRIAWFSAGATFRTYQGEAAQRTENRIAFAVGEQTDFQELYQSKVPTWVNHWRYNWDTDVRLNEPATEVYVKYTGRPAVNAMRACLHLLPQRPAKKTVQVVHGYRAGKILTQKKNELDGPTEYTIECISPPENEFITISVPSN
jgi:hypothetical protein